MSFFEQNPELEPAQCLQATLLAATLHGIELPPGFIKRLHERGQRNNTKWSQKLYQAVLTNGNENGLQVVYALRKMEEHAQVTEILNCLADHINCGDGSGDALFKTLVMELSVHDSTFYERVNRRATP